MSKYVFYYNTRQRMYKDLASSWMELTADMDLSDEIRRGMALFFKPIGRRFGLIREFRNVGVI